MGATIGHNAFVPDVAITFGYSSMLGTSVRFKTLSFCNKGSGCNDGLLQTGSSTSVGFNEKGGLGFEETEFLRDCRVLAEIAEKGGILDKCMGPRVTNDQAMDQECQDTISNDINERKVGENWNGNFSLPRRNDCYSCFLDGISSENDCDARMSDCDSTVKKLRKCSDDSECNECDDNECDDGNTCEDNVCTDSSGDYIWLYYGPGMEAHGEPTWTNAGGVTYVVTTTKDNYKESDRLFNCFGMTGDGLHQDTTGAGLLQLRSNSGLNAKTTAFMGTTGLKG